MAKRKSSAAEVIEIDRSEEPVLFHEEPDEVPPGTLRRSPFQDRTVDPKTLPELASSLRRLGLLQRIVVRRCTDGVDEIIAGHRRNGAAELAGLGLVPITRKFDVPDDIAAEMVIVENAQREDPHPLDECAGFVRLRDTFGRTVEQLATKINRKASYVYQRLYLERLSPASRDAFYARTFGLGVALELANIRDHGRQDRALKDMVAASQGEEITIARARAVVRERFLLRLAQAPFDARDAELVPAAGACAQCSKNSANRPQLFPEGDAFGKDDLCTDGVCWDDKKDASWEQQTAEAQAKGVRIATRAEADQIFPDRFDDRPAAGYVDLARGDVDTDGKPWKAVLGKERIGAVETVLVRDKAGNPHQVALRSEVVKTIKKAPKAKDPERFQPPDPKEAEERAKAKTAKAIDEEVARRVAVAVRAFFESGKKLDLLPFWRAFAMWLVARVDDGSDDLFAAVAKARELSQVDEATGEVIEWRSVVERDAATLETQLQLGALIAQVAVFDDTADEKGRRMADSVIDALDIDARALRKQAAREVKAST